MIVAALILLGVAGAAFLVRLVRGPSLADRVVALDGLLASVAIAITANAARTGEAAVLVVTVVVALVAFLGTVTFARFIEQRGS